MRVDYSDKSFMLSWDNCRAWFTESGELKDAEYKRKYKGHPAAVAVSQKHTKVIAWLKKQGLRESQLLARGVLIRKVTT